MAQPTWSALERAAGSLNIELQKVEVRSSNEFERVFSRIGKGRVDAVVVNQDALFNANVSLIADIAMRKQLPSSGTRDFAEAGGVLGYGFNASTNNRRAAHFVDKILKGAQPADLPVEQPTKFELVINLTTAKALGLTIPQSLLVRADETSVINRRAFMCGLALGTLGAPFADRPSRPYEPIESASYRACLCLFMGGPN